MRCRVCIGIWEISFPSRLKEKHQWRKEFVGRKRRSPGRLLFFVSLCAVGPCLFVFHILHLKPFWMSLFWFLAGRWPTVPANPGLGKSLTRNKAQQDTGRSCGLLSLSCTVAEYMWHVPTQWVVNWNGQLLTCGFAVFEITKIMLIMSWSHRRKLLYKNMLIYYT